MVQEDWEGLQHRKQDQQPIAYRLAKQKIYYLMAEKQNEDTYPYGHSRKINSYIRQHDPNRKDQEQSTIDLYKPAGIHQSMLKKKQDRHWMFDAA
ncbi:hypothetical protein C3F00_046665 [Pseudomonas sp. MWU13-2860]|nr:hypothetical protein C3F00_046665 [Pseudomonas sp. MWU13-2860]